VSPSTVTATQNVQLEIEIHRSILGPITLPETIPALRIQDSIVASTADGSRTAAAMAASGTSVEVQSCTVFGTLQARALDASNSILSGVVTTVRRQVGCLRFCFVPDESLTGRRYRCQPELAIEAEPNVALHAGMRLRIQPSFTSATYGEPGYAQLSEHCAAEIASGAEDASEMGVFDFLKQPQREVNLRSSLEEYLRFGLEAGVFFVS
jgi:hypothetical protein